MGFDFDPPGVSPKTGHVSRARPEEIALRELEAIFQSARDETFEYGETSGFADELPAFSTAGTAGLGALTTLVFEGKQTPREASAEAIAVLDDLSNDWLDPIELISLCDCLGTLARRSGTLPASRCLTSATKRAGALY